jgi:hypothetical protein
LPGGAQENHKNLSKDSWWPDQDLSRAPPEYRSTVLLQNQPTRCSSLLDL